MRKVVSFSCWSSAAYMKANDRERMEAFICDYQGECKMYASGKCVCKNLIFGWVKCPHSRFIQNYGLTKRARNFGAAAARWREMYHTDIVTETSRLCQCGDYIYLPYPHLDVFGEKVDESLVNKHFIPVERFDLQMVEKIMQHRPRALMGGEIEEFQKEQVPKFIQHLAESFPDLFAEYQLAHQDQAEHLASIAQDYTGRKAYLHTMKDGASFYDCHKNLWVKRDGFVVCEAYSTSLCFPAGHKPRKCLHELTDDMVVKVGNNEFVSDKTVFAD